MVVVAIIVAMIATMVVTMTAVVVAVVFVVITLLMMMATMRAMAAGFSLCVRDRYRMAETQGSVMEASKSAFDRAKNIFTLSSSVR